MAHPDSNSRPLFFRPGLSPESSAADALRMVVTSSLQGAAR